jgi:glutaredoxin 3
MSDVRRKIEIFGAGCPACDNVVARVKAAACRSCDVVVLDMHEAGTQKRAAEIGISAVPAVVIDGVLADCCKNRGVDLEVLRAAGLGRPIA